MAIKQGRFRLPLDVSGTASSPIYFGDAKPKAAPTVRVFNSGSDAFDLSVGGSVKATVYSRCSVDIASADDISVAVPTGGSAITAEGSYEFLDAVSIRNAGIRNGRFNLVGAGAATTPANPTAFAVDQDTRDGGLIRVLNTTDAGIDIEVAGASGTSATIRPRQSLDFAAGSKAVVQTADAQGIYVNVLRDDLSRTSQVPAGRFKIVIPATLPTGATLSDYNQDIVDLLGLSNGTIAVYRVANSSDSSIRIDRVRKPSGNNAKDELTLFAGQTLDIVVSSGHRLVVIADAVDKIIEGSVEFVSLAE